MIPLVVIGAGGFGREVWSHAVDVAETAGGLDLLGVVDDALSESSADALHRMGAPYLGTITWLKTAPSDVQAIIAIGSAQARASIDRLLEGRTWASLVHPSATIGRDVQLGPGTVVAPGARLSTAIRTGRHVHIDQGVTVGHDCTLEDFSRLNPQACISGTVTIGNSTTIGANATVIQGLTVGDCSLVGAGAVVTRNVPAHTTVKGVPAR